tara:strand:- start:119 stop:457 length:339 start_codon:yes stop_codon:yes gene_type:complete
MVGKAAEVLRAEILLLERMSLTISKKKSHYTKQCVDMIAEVEREINGLLAKAGVSEEYNALQNRKSELRGQLDQVLAQIDEQIDQAETIVVYLKSRVDALEKESAENTETEG